VLPFFVCMEHACLSHTKHEGDDRMVLSRLGKNKHIVKGRVRCGLITKHVISSLRPGDIAVISHTNIDEVAARDLVERKVGAVVNCAVSFTGEYATNGAKILLESCIPLYDCPTQPDLPKQLSSGEEVVIDGHYLFRKHGRVLLTRLSPITQEKWQLTSRQAEQNMGERLERFIDNTLQYALREKQQILNTLPSLPLGIQLMGKPVLIVSRGKHYKEDLQALNGYIATYRPVLIGVDGGGDALMEHGWTPDIIIGDMDSVSDTVLRMAREIIVHAYLDGTAPGEKRVQELELPYHILPAPGTSEDAALLYVYDCGASLLVSVGTHTTMADFLEKERQGMASTLLVRMKVGNRLVDAKGIHLLYPSLSFSRASWLQHLRTFIMQVKI
jgi:uncharacterized membrane-anchored protein